MRQLTNISLAAVIAVLAACGGQEAEQRQDDPTKRVIIVSQGPNAVSTWNEIAVNTMSVPAVATGATPSERSPQTADVATVQLAIYDAAMGVVGTHKPYAVTAGTGAIPGDPVAMRAAIVEAAYWTLKGLFPSRGDKYEAEYASAIAALPEGGSKSAGVAIGREVAGGMLARRANDGRETALPAYVPGTAPGQFRGTNPVNRVGPYIRPFVTLDHAQFRPPAPYALDSAAYAADLAEVKAAAGTGSTQRTDAQSEVARFHTEPPGAFWGRNLRLFGMASADLAENARLLAMLWTAFADAGSACFEAKYHYNFWRPTSAIRLADTDGNPATDVDAQWTPFVATPNHPEYPAAHGCATGTIMRVVRRFYGTDNVAFDFTSTVTATTHHFERTTDLLAEMQNARVWGGMHFRASTLAGDALGASVADWMVANQFGLR